jgi:DNA polymerase III subunit delta'
MKYSWNVIGHEKELTQLERYIEKPGHAYLFLGPERVGKFTIARKMAQILQCPNNFCHNCPTCTQVGKSAHLDTIEISDDGNSLKLEQMREIIARLNMTGHGRYKILLMENIGRLTPEAANSLLKLLEEPPVNTLFFFTATRPSDVIPTIRSRMQSFRFKLTPESSLKKTLTDKYPNLASDSIEYIVMLALGKPGASIELIENPELLDEHRELFDITKSFYHEPSIARRFKAVRELVEDSEKLKAFLLLLTAYARYHLLKTDGKHEQEKLIEAIEATQQTLALLKRNVNAKLATEHLSLRMSSL